jgi:hypothetical protein
MHRAQREQRAFSSCFSASSAAFCKQCLRRAVRRRRTSRAADDGGRPSNCIGRHPLTAFAVSARGRSRYLDRYGFSPTSAAWLRFALSERVIHAEVVAPPRHAVVLHVRGGTRGGLLRLLRTLEPGRRCALRGGQHTDCLALTPCCVQRLRHPHVLPPHDPNFPRERLAARDALRVHGTRRRTHLYKHRATERHGTAQYAVRTAATPAPCRPPVPSLYVFPRRPSALPGPTRVGRTP